MSQALHDHALKEYQSECLEVLAKFCDETRLGQGRRPEAALNAS